jgi:carbamoyl-phosphate synthase large subunit
VIGSELVLFLHARGARLLVGDLKPRPSQWPQEIVHRQGDLSFITKRELDAFAPQIVFHLAASFERSVEAYEFWDEQWRNNAALSHHLMTLLKDSPALLSVVFASSYLIYDKSLYLFDQAPDTPRRLVETDAVCPRNLTGASKLMHEIELTFVNRFTRLPVCCARIYRSYGKSSRDVISRFVRLLREQRPIEVYHPENRFDFIYAADVAEGLIRLAERRVNGIVNLGSGRARRVAEIVDSLRDHFPKLVVREVAARDRFEASEADLCLLKELTDWAPTVSLEEGIRRIVEHENNDRGVVETRPLRILVTSAARKVPMVRAVRAAMEKFGGGTLLGGDVDPQALAKHFVDAFWTMPNSRDRDLGRIQAYLKKQRIRVVIPSRDGELEFWAKHKEALAADGIAVMVSGPRAIGLTLDKLRFAAWGRKSRFPIIPTSARIESLRCLKYVVKERFGAGSRSIGIDLTRSAAVQHATRLEAPIFQPFVKGKEYSVDVYVDRHGRAKGGVVRERNLVVDGESQVTTIVQDAKAAAICMRLAEKLRLSGHSVFQVLKDSEKKLHIIECNARFGGASSASMEAGLESFYWFFVELAGGNLADYPFLPRPKLMMVRVKNDVFVS